MQVAILAGGLGTRLGPLTEAIPKSMVPIEGRPFLQYKLELLKSCGFSDMLLCIGHLGHQIHDFFGDGRKWGVRIEYSDEGDRLLGTGGAIKKAESLLEERFFVIYGDSYLPVDPGEVMSRLEQRSRLGTMVVYKNENRYDSSNVILDGDQVLVYDKQTRHPDMAYIDAGLSLFRREAIDLIPPDQTYPLESLFQGLIQRNQLAAYETQQRFYEVGSPRGLEEFREFVNSGGVQSC